MATFNAGSIDASLTLDRSAFTRELNAAKEQARLMEKNGIKPKLSIQNEDALTKLAARIEKLSNEQIKIPLNIDGREQLTALQQQLNRLDGKKIDVNLDASGFDELVALDAILNEIDGRKLKIDLDLGNAIDKLILLEEILNRIDGRNINIDLKIDHEVRLLELEAKIKALDGQNINLDVKTNKSALSSVEGGITRVQAIITAVLLAAPLLAAALGPATAVVVGLAGALTAAAGGLGVLGLGVAGTVGDMLALREELGKQQTKLAEITPGTDAYKKQLEKISNLQKTLATQYGAASDGLNRIKDAYAKFDSAVKPAALDLLGKFFGIIADILPRLVPIFDTFAKVASDGLSSISTFINGPEGARMLAFFEEFGSLSFDLLLQILGNLVLLFGRLFEAFAPFALTILNYLAQMTAKWAAWADGIGRTQGFIDFMSYVNTVGPQVFQLLVDFGTAVFDLGLAFAPFAGPILSALTGVFGAISRAPVGVLTALIGLVGGLYLAFVTINVVMALYNGLTVVWAGVQTAAAIATAIFTGAVKLFNIALAANPIGLVVLALVALVAGLVYAYKHFEGFRNIVDTVVRFVVTTFTAGMKLTIDSVMFAATLIGQYFNIIRTVITSVLSFVGNFISSAWTGYVAVIRAEVNIISAVVSAAFRVVQTVVSTVLGVVTGLVSAAWAAIRVAFNAGGDIIRAVISGDFGAIPGIITRALSSIDNIAYNAMIGMYNAIVRGVQLILNILGGLGDHIGNIVGDLGGVLYNAGVSIIQGLINGIQNSIGAVTRLLQSVTNRIPSWKGPAERDANLLRPAGRLIMGGLIGSIEDQVPGLEASLGKITNRIAATNLGMMQASMAGAQIASQGRMAGADPAGRTVQVTVQAFNPVAEKSSVTAVREITTLGALGVFDG